MACSVKSSSFDSAMMASQLEVEESVVLYWLAAAHQPMSGGGAPTTAPTQVLTGCILFNGVYTKAYRARLPAPNIAVVGLTPYHSIPVPSMPLAIANTTAALLLTRPRTRGLFRVRLILASYDGSNSMLSVLAEAIVRKVPPVRYRKVSALREGASVTDVLSSAGTGYSEYEAEDVRTTRKARRGFERARKLEKVLRSDFAGAAAAVCDSVDEASGGRGTSARLDVAAFKRFRLRCGGSSAAEGAFGVLIVDEGAFGAHRTSPAPSDSIAPERVSCPLDSQRLKAFVQKNVLSIFSSRATALWNLRGIGREAGVVEACFDVRAQSEHIEVPFRDRNSAVDGGRRGIGCCAALF